MFPIKINILLVSFLVTSIIKLNAQNRSFSLQHYGPEEGLSNANVFAVKQNKNHIIYLSTENGIYNFDGYNFEKIKPKNSLKSNYIRNLEFNQNNHLVIIHRREGIYEYDDAKNEVSLNKNIRFNTSVDELIIDTAYAYSLTEQISVSAIELKSGKIIEDQIKIANNANQAFAIYKTSKHKVLIGRSDGLYEFINGIQVKINLGKTIPVYAITEDGNGTLYLGSDDAIVCLNNNSITKTIPVKIKKENNFFIRNSTTRVSKLIVDKYQRIWFTSLPDDNLYMIENDITYDAFDFLGIDKVLINCIYKDSDDHIWIGTFNDGLYFIQNTQLHNVSFSNKRKILSVNNALFIQNHIILGTNNGLLTYNKEKNIANNIVSPDELFDESIYNIDQKQQNIVYSKSNSMDYPNQSINLNNSTYKFTAVAGRFFKFCANSSEAYLADETASLLKIKNYHSTNYKVLDTIISYTDYRTRINTLFETKKDILVGTSDGLTIYSLETKTNTRFKNEMFNFSINDICNFNGKTYLAHDNGITILEDSLLIQQIGTHQLTSVKKIKFYQNKIWLATLDGLYICDQKFNPIANYNKSNGFISNTINDITFKNNNCCICSDKGITICTINNLLNQIIKPNKLFISKIEIDGINTGIKNHVLKLNSSQSDVMIHFSSPLFIKPNKQYYKYKFDNKTFDIENRQIHLTSIQGGKHQLEISCSYDDINWSQPITITITKDTPFQQTILFLILVIAGALLFISIITFIFFKIIRSKAFKRVQEERQVNLLKHQAMNSLMSPHFIFNSLTSIQNYINMNDALKASEYLGKFSRLIRMIIEKASQSEITLHEELTRLNYYLDLEKERFKGKFDFHIEVDADIDTLSVKIPNMIIQPYAENSIIHGILPKHEHGNLYIKFKKTDHTALQIIIEDDGIGFNSTKNNIKAGHKSLGTKTIESILELNTKLTGKNQKVEIIDKHDLNQNETGTRITITIQI